MACCCKEEEQENTDLFAPLSCPDASPPSPPSLILSPMNSNFKALSSADLLQSILERLPPRDLARSTCVCRLWRAVASDRAMLERAFAGPWGVKQVVGMPSSTAFWRYSSLTRFAISHRLVRGDTVAGLALKYSVQVLSFGKIFKKFVQVVSLHQKKKNLLIWEKGDFIAFSSMLSLSKY